MNTKTPQLFRGIAFGVSALVCALSANFGYAQAPQITGFTPFSAGVGDTVTIAGQNFGLNPSDNTVWFGAVQANVQTSSSSSLSVTVPNGATFAPLTVTVNGRIGSSPFQFDPTFVSSAPFDLTSLQSPFTLTTGSVPGSSAIVDLDGDGKPDYAVMSVSASGTIVSIFRNIGTVGALSAASFAPRVDIVVAPSGDAWLTVNDVDGDGKPDLVFSSRDTSLVSVMRNVSTPGSLTVSSFAPRADLVTGPSPEGVKLGDIDGDGRIDIVVPNYGSNTVSVFRNIGSPGAITTNSFAAKVDFTIASGAFSVVLGDIDGDGKLDVVAPADNAGVVSILRNTSSVGVISFASNVDFATGARPLGANTADLDGDGKVDVFVANYNSGSLSVFKNMSTPGSISLAPKFDIATATGGSPHSVAIADIDGDGKPDMLTETEGSDGMMIYRNIGTNGSLTAGSFATPLVFATGSNPWITTVGDVDGDGRPDIFVANNYSGTVSVYKNVLPANAPAITSQPQNATSVVGSNATFSVTATGAPPLTYQWLLNGAQISGATTSSFTVNNPQLSDDGSSYSVIVTNSYGAVTSVAAVLIVGQAPVIQMQPQSQSVLAGGDITLSVTVSNGFSAASLPSVSSGTLRMWLKADAGVITNGTGQVSQWQDQSGNNNDAFAPTVAVQPTLVRPAVLGGNPAVRFDGIRDNVNGDYLHGTNDVGIPDAYTSFAVYNAFQTTNNENLLTCVGYPGRYYGECRIDGIAAQDMSYSGWAYDYPTPFTVPTNTYRIWTDRVNTNLSQVEVFDTTASRNTNFSFSLSQFSAPAAGFFIGGLDPSYQYVVNGRNFNGDIAELIYFRGKLTDADRLAVQQYLEDKYLGTSTAGLTFQWRLNGTNIIGATNSTLTITNAQFANAGKYDVVICGATYAGCTTSSAASIGVTGCASAPSDLISWWPGDGGTWDIVGTNNGTFVNGSAYAAGEVGQAFKLNGSSSYINIPDSQTLRPTSVTISGWFEFDRSTGTQVLVAKTAGTGSSESFVLYMINGSLGAAIGDATSNGSSVGYSLNPVAGTWYHIAYSFDGTTFQQALYVNGVLRASGNAGKSIGYDSHPMMIGAEYENEAVSFFQAGAADEVTLFGRALSATEIQSMYNSGSLGICKSLAITAQPQSQTIMAGDSGSLNVGAVGSSPLTYQWYKDGSAVPQQTNAVLPFANVQLTDAGSYFAVATDPSGSVTSSVATVTVQQNMTNGCVSAPSGLVGWWPGDGGAGDLAGTNNGTFNGSVFTPGEVGPAFKLNGSNGYVSIPDSSTLRPSSVTLSGWFEFDRSTGSQVLVSKTVGTGPSDSYIMYMVNGSLAALTGDAGGNGPAVAYNLSPVAGTWYHIAYTFDGSTLQQALYVNGVLRSSGSASKAIGYDSHPVLIGAEYENEVLSFFQAGAADEVTVFSRALSASEIQSMYNAGSSGMCRSLAIISQPQSQTLFAGSSGSLKVAAMGGSPLTYQWYKGGSLLPQQTNTALPFTNVQLGDAGSYFAVSTDSSGSVTSSVAVVTVQQAATAFVENFEPGIHSNLWSAFGGLVVATNYGGYVSPINSCWFGGDGSRFATTAALNTSAGGNISFYLRIANGSAFPWELADLPGEGVVLEYSVNSGSTWTTIGTYNTSAYFTWTNIHTSIPAGAQFGGTLFRWRQLSNSGASFDHWALDDIQINASPMPPTITAQPQSQTVAVGANAAFNIGVTGSLPMAYQWMRNGNVVVGTNTSLVVSNLQLSDSGNGYSVVLSNAYGSVTSAVATVTVTSGLSQGLIAYYPFSGNANDASGHGNNGNPTNVTYNTDRFGQPGAAADFSAGNAYVEVPTLNAMPYSPVTYSVWFKLNRYPTAAEQRNDGYSVMTLAGRDLSGSQSQGVLCVFNQTSMGITEDLQYYTGATAVTSHRTPPTNQWIQVVFTEDASNNATFYVNGQYVDSSVFTAAQNLVAPFRIGASDTLGGGRLSWLGEIDDVRIYNRTLTSNEVTQLFISEAPSGALVPTIQNQPQGINQAIGTDAIFTVTATGVSPLSYQWQFNGSPIAGATNSSLTVTNVQPANVGTYDVIVCSGSSCTNSSDATLTVGTPPSISADPQSQRVSTGANVSFTVTANGSLPISYQWRFNGASIAGATDSVLTLSNVQHANAGSYSAIVTNVFGTASSGSAVLSVDVTPSIVAQPQNQTVTVGGTATFSVSADPILPNVTSGTLRLWLKADAGVVTNSNGLVQWQDQSGNANDASAPTTAAEPSVVYPAALAGRPVIRFDGIQDNVNGDYLRGTNDVGIPDAYTSFTVYNVIQTTNNENVMTCVGYPGRYYGECRIDGIAAQNMGYSGWAYDYPTPFVVPTNTYRIWTDRVDTNLSQVELFDTTAVSSTNFSYSLSQFSAPAPGFFIGGVDPSWQYVVNGRNFNGDFAEIMFYRGKLTDADRLAVEQYLKAKYLQAAATSGYTYQWQFNGIAIAGATNSTLTISNAQTGDVGNYDVVVCNGNACTTSSNATLTVNVPPSITQQPVDQAVVVGGNATFSAAASGTAPLSYQWQHNGTDVSGETNTSFSIASVQQLDAGSYDLVVTSPYGTATSSNAVLSVATSTLVVANVSGSGSSAVQVPVSLIALGTENAVGFSLNFDPSLLSIGNVALGAGASGATIFYNTNQQSSGHLGVVVSYTSGGTFAAGTQEVAVVTFNVAIVATNTTTPITFGDNPTVRQISDSLANSLPAAYVPGVLTLSQTVFEGDVAPRPNGDQRVTITDWVQVGRFVAGLDTPSSPEEFQRVDCAPLNTLGNGKLTVSDWVQAGRFAVGLDPLTPVGGPTTPNGNAIMQPRVPVSRTISLQTGTTSGPTNIVGVQLNSQGDESAVGFSLSFDSKLVQFTGAKIGSGATGATMNVNTTQAGNGTIGVALELPFGQTFATGTQQVVQLSFVPVVYSPGTSNLAFTDSPVIRDVSDATANSLSVSFVNSSLTTTGLIPKLSITQDGSGNVTLMWPASANGYGLESVSDLSTNWQPVPAAVVTNGANVFLTQPAATNQLYFRLRHP